MAEFDPLAPSQESGNFDNGFEKLDPLTLSTNQDEFVSSTQHEEDDLYNASPERTPDIESLIDLQPSAPREPFSECPAKEEIQSHVPIVGEPENAEMSENWRKRVDPRVKDLVLWRNVKKTAVVVGSTLVLLVSLACCSVLSVLAYLCLAVLTVALSFVVYKKIMAAVQKTNEGHPFKQYLEVDINLPEEKVHEIADKVMKHASKLFDTLRRLFLIEDVVDSLKFGLGLWVLTYVGAWFNGMTLIILGVIGLFTWPKVYETYQVQIDNYIDIFRTRVTDVMAQIKAKIPLGKKKEE